MYVVHYTHKKYIVKDALYNKNNHVANMIVSRNVAQKMLY